MEKYCKKCGKVFDDLNFKLCPYCGSELATRYGRQPIPRKLRHEVFKRDGYRCRECGASKDETSLEIDHILPVAKGGTNDIDNLQTLCRECNRMKHTDEWVGGETDLEIIERELKLLNNQLTNAMEGIKNSHKKDDKLEFQFRIVKLTEEIQSVQKKKSDFIAKNNEQKKNKRLIIAKKEKQDKLFKQLYVELDDNSLIKIKSNIECNSNDKTKIIKFLITNFDEYHINELLIKIGKQPILEIPNIQYVPIVNPLTIEETKNASNKEKRDSRRKRIRDDIRAEIHRSKSPKTPNKKVKQKSLLKWKSCEICGKKVNKVAKTCPYCGYEF